MSTVIGSKNGFAVEYELTSEGRHEDTQWLFGRMLAAPYMKRGSMSGCLTKFWTGLLRSLKNLAVNDELNRIPGLLARPGRAVGAAGSLGRGPAGGSYSARCRQSCSITSFS